MREFEQRYVQGHEKWLRLVERAGGGEQREGSSLRPLRHGTFSAGV